VFLWYNISKKKLGFKFRKLIMKNFDEWFEFKKKLNEKGFIPPKVKIGEFWWASLGLNVGEEIDGKSEKYTRPVLILKKINRKNFLVIPGTTTERIGKLYFKIVFENNVSGYFCLNQIRVISYKRLDKKYTEKNIKESDFISIKNVLADYYLNAKLIPPLKAGGTEVDTAPHISTIIN
jgi:mRNA interferase MazF